MADPCPVIDLETFAASRRPRRTIGEICVREGRVVVQVNASWTPEQAEHYGRFLVYLAESARRGEEADG
jgi:hypothetical protein